MITNLHKTAIIILIFCLNISNIDAMENLNSLDDVAKLLFHYAENKDWHNFHLTLPYQGNINKTKNGYSLLHYACLADNKAKKCVNLCLDKGARVNAEDTSITNPANQISTPLHCAAETGNVKVIRILLNAGADINSTYNKFGNTPLHITSWFGYDKCTQLLIDRRAKLDVPNIHGSTPVHSAAWKNEVVCLKILLEKEAPFCIRNTTGIGNTPLYLAAKAGSTECLRLLLKYIGNDQQQIGCECSGNNSTAIQAAAIQGHMQCYWDLVIAHADYTKKISDNNILKNNSELLDDNYPIKTFLQIIEQYGENNPLRFRGEYYSCFLCLKDFQYNDVILTTKPCQQTFHVDCFENYSVNYFIVKNKNQSWILKLKDGQSNKEFKYSVKTYPKNIIPFADQCPTCKVTFDPQKSLSLAVFLEK